MNWDYLQPVTIHFGKGRVHEIKKIRDELPLLKNKRDNLYEVIEK